MKRGVFIINTARGAVINTKALVDALKSGKVAGAGLDVFEKEPIENDNPLLSLDNVVLTPHTAAQTQDAISRLMRQNGEQVEKALNGIYENVVNPKVLEKD
jgi:D-3-phosphoglycerate dehydrogenase